MDYRFQIASDVTRDGLGLELIDASGKLNAEVFRCDATHSLTVSLFVENLPFVQIEKLLLTARKELAPYEDGTPLPAATDLQSA
ncbi:MULTISPECIES: hypothetical protein [Pseudomonas syringae group]|uniref:Uncharacterized protein n=6 Tax=Pseudomonas syringae group TaxID=136849 RepID=A0A261WMS4_9PSED|nr:MULTISPECIES: hypothetical protein [Pseudomonas syringae group]AQL35516.1 hypothetical protein JN853_02805 [Pseudomonas syringae pv. actinidiae ICMP 9853]EGH65205.1 MoxR-like ATPase [Pseudomonas syringae pv. actinidiae str. M302091]EPM46116.1 MoxR-like ATPase [Pseudomonas syringae pv. actinidiae ICMP 19103]EPM83229.1 MoxR-like ATPase [Pseudomonas syringae pv. actinidiae ICMP 19068]EPM93411.1 MoxR-like ATPase [Pseudomonas syringae pv. actinidiae ICMP 19104]EPN00474.1 MoxR-like ATPase [Pseud